MKKRLLSLAVLTAGLVGIQTANAQVEVGDVAEASSIDFTGFLGTGFNTTASEGGERLNSNTWSVTGLKRATASTNGLEDVNFAGSYTEPLRSYSRGEVALPVLGGAASLPVAGGVSAGVVNSGADTVLLVTPKRTADNFNYFNGGVVVLALENTSGKTINRLDLSYVAGVLDAATGDVNADYGVAFQYLVGGTYDASSIDWAAGGITNNTLSFNTNENAGADTYNETAAKSGVIIGDDGLGWAHGDMMWLRWIVGTDDANGVDVNTDGFDHFDAFTLDDITFTAYEEINIVEFADFSVSATSEITGGAGIPANEEALVYSMEDNNGGAGAENLVASVVIDEGSVGALDCDVTFEIVAPTPGSNTALATTEANNADDAFDYYLDGILNDLTEGDTVVNFTTNSATFEFNTIDDLVHQGDRSAKIRITGATGGCVVGANNEIELIIVENDPGVIQFTLNAYDYTEAGVADGVTGPVTVETDIETNVSAPIVITDNATADFGKATNAVDYGLDGANNITASVGFEVGSSLEAEFSTLHFVDDELVEADEAFNLGFGTISQLTVNTNAEMTIGANSAAAVGIEDNDVAELTWDATTRVFTEIDTVVGGVNYTDYNVTITTNNPIKAELTVTVASNTVATLGEAGQMTADEDVHGADATAGTDDDPDFVLIDSDDNLIDNTEFLALSFDYDDASMSKNFTIRVFQDENIEDEEVFTFHVTAATPVLVGAALVADEFVGSLASDLTGTTNTNEVEVTLKDDDYLWVGFESASASNNEYTFNLTGQVVPFELNYEGANGVDNTVQPYMAAEFEDGIDIVDPTGTAVNGEDFVTNVEIAEYFELTVTGAVATDGFTWDGVTNYVFDTDFDLGADDEESALNAVDFINTLTGFFARVQEGTTDVVEIYFVGESALAAPAAVGGIALSATAAPVAADLVAGFLYNGVVEITEGTFDAIGDAASGFRFIVLDDDIAEQTETATFTISQGSNTKVKPWAGQETYELTILDEDAMFVDVDASLVPDTIMEGDSIKITLTAGKTPVADVTVGFALVADSSDAISNDASSLPQVTFTPSGSLTQEVWITITDDNEIEDFERLYLAVEIVSGFGAQMELDNEFETLIQDNDFVKVGFETATYSALEGTGGDNAQPLTVVYDANGKVNLPTVTVSIKEIVGGTATADDDYEFNEDTFVMNPANIEDGKLVISRNFHIDTDDVIETDETIYYVVTTTSDDVELTNDTLEFTIVNDDVSLVEFDSFGATVTEGTGSNDTIYFNVVANAPVSGTVEISVDGTTSATNFDDYTVNFADNDQVVFNQTPGITTKQYFVVVKGDAISESTETVVITLSNPSNAVQLGEKTTYTLVIKDDENPVVEGTIADAKTNGGQTLVTADVQSLNYGAGTGDVFAVISDASGSIFLDINTTSVVAGSQVLVQGEVVTKNGLEVFDASSMFVSGNGTVLAASAASAAFAAADVATAKELACVEVVDAANWTVTTNSSNNHGSFAIAEVTDGTNSWFVRIDDDSPLFGSAAPVGTFDVEGFVSTETGAGFFLMAGSTLDAKANAAFTSAEVDGDGNWSFSADNTGDSYEWNIDGTSYTTQVADHKFDDTTTVSVSLTVTVDGCSHTVSKDVAVTGIGINEIASVVTNIYPNPTSGVVTVAANTEIENVVVVNALGAIVAEIAGGSKEVEVNLSNNANGVYFVNVFANGEVIAKRIIKQ